MQVLTVRAEISRGVRWSMKVCPSGEVFGVRPERVLRESYVVHCGEAPGAAASFNLSPDQAPVSGPRWISAFGGRRP